VRNPERIRPIISMLEKLWNHNPDMRLGQLISNLCHPAEPFYIDDETLRMAIKDQLNDLPNGVTSRTR
jgi:uncharacterized protein YihD (DUF1040 family)